MKDKTESAHAGKRVAGGFFLSSFSVISREEFPVSASSFRGKFFLRENKEFFLHVFFLSREWTSSGQEERFPVSRAKSPAGRNLPLFSGISISPASSDMPLPSGKTSSRQRFRETGENPWE